MNDELTLNYYNDQAKHFVEQTISLDMSALYTPFVQKLNHKGAIGGQILDLGCGSGRDSLYFAQLGFEVTAIDGSLSLIKMASEHHAMPNLSWACLTFEQVLNKGWQNKFDGIWACASLLHVAYADIALLINQLLGLLNHNGIFYASFKYGESERLDNNRFFCDMNERRWEVIKLKLDNKINDTIWLTLDQRQDRENQWFNILIET